MRDFFHKYSSKLILYVLTVVIFISCVQKHKFANEKKQLSEKKMVNILTDILLMEAYVNEKMVKVSSDSLALVKQSFYPDILKHHKTDSALFYSTFNYFQSHPEEFSKLLSMVDSNLIKIKPLDTTFVKPATIEPPKDIEKLGGFRAQEEAMRKEYLKKNPTLQKLKDRKSKKEQEN